jgi:two-component system, NarL family, sensor kinase
MPTTKGEVIIVIITVIIILLFLGILLLVMTVYYAKRRRQMQEAQKALYAEFEQQLLQSKLEIQEQTFSFISDEIHDNVGQVLSLAKMQLAMLEQKGVFNLQAIKTAKEGVGSAIAELRDLAKSLSPERVQAFDLAKNIQEEVQRINKSGMAAVHFQVGEVPDALPGEKKLMLFRVVQECLQNTVKHASATNIYINLDTVDYKVDIQLRDNGVGFNVDEALKRHNGLGLANMQRRVQLMGGSFAVNSAAGQGTHTHIQISVA